MLAGSILKYATSVGFGLALCAVGVAQPAAEVLDLGGGTRIRFVTPAPQLRGGTAGLEPVYSADGTVSIGPVRQQRTLIRDSDGIRITLSLTNTGSEPVMIDKVTVMEVVGQDDCQVAQSGIREWALYRLARHKNDIPGPFRPTRLDDAARDATEGNVQGGNAADEPEAASGEMTIYHSDPAMVVMSDRAPDAHVFIGFSGQTQHLSDVAITVNGTDKSFVSLRANAEFDGVVLPPGASRRTHELFIKGGKPARDLLADHVERIKAQSGARSSKIRNVFCTWYFYGPEIRADTIRADLAELKKRPINFDAFLIDYNWDDKFGDWNANLARFPEGMKAMADEIAAAGFVPGIWTCPFLIEPNADALVKYPDLPLRDREGVPVKFVMAAMETCYVLDPTAPSAPAFLRELCEKLTGWGYRYLKFDFLRAVTIYNEAVFHDATATRAQAYKKAIDVLRQAAGEDVTIGVWGGLFEANAGFVDINRSGSDVRGHWDAFGDYAPVTRYPVRMRQTFARSFYDEKLWTSDQDALQLRRRTKPWGATKPHITQGRFTDAEAFSTVVYRFLGGGVVQVSEKLDELDQDRYDLYKAVIPTYAPVAIAFKGWDDYLPEYFVSHFTNHPDFAPWAVVSLCNWNGGEGRRLSFTLSEVPGLPAAPHYAAFDFQRQVLLGVFKATDTIALDLEPHAAAVVRVTPLRSDGSVLIGTDLNLSGGMELKSRGDGNVSLREELRKFPASITFLDWRNGQAAVRKVALEPL